MGLLPLQSPGLGPLTGFWLLSPSVSQLVALPLLSCCWPASLQQFDNMEIAKLVVHEGLVQCLYCISTKTALSAPTRCSLCATCLHLLKKNHSNAHKHSLTHTLRPNQVKCVNPADAPPSVYLSYGPQPVWAPLPESKKWRQQKD